jgi:hypothetical protein
MSEADLRATWRQLLRNRPIAEDQLAIADVLRDGVATGLQAAVDAAGELRLRIPVGGPPTRTLPADVNGLRLRHREVVSGQWLELSSPAAHEAMFAPLCNQVIDAVHLEGREPWAAANTIVRNWQSAWRPVRQPMSKAEQTGLIGELVILRALWLPALGPAAVHLWSGPETGRHDFVGRRLHMEVKTTRTSRHEHEISRVDQLSAASGRRLLLASVQLEESSAGSETLGTLVDDIGCTIGGDPSAVDAFMSRILAMRWSEDMRRSPELLRCNVRDAQIFEVDDEFPRLPEGFALPSGITAIRYTISLSNLPRLDPARVRSDIEDQGADPTED